MAEHFCYQGLSALADRYVQEFGTDSKSDNQAPNFPTLKSGKHFLRTEKRNPTMIGPMALIGFRWLAAKWLLWKTMGFV